MEHALVGNTTTRGHHHTTADSVERVRGKTSSRRDTPTKEERGKEVLRELTGQEDGLKRVVQTEVETTVHNDTHDRGNETTVETHDTVDGHRLAVDINETVELALTTLGSRLGIVSETSTGVVERVHEDERRGTSGTTRSNVRAELLPVRSLLRHTEEGLEVVLEGEVQGLSREVTDDVSSVTAPQRGKALVLVRADKAVTDTLVGAGETALLNHLILVLDEELHTLNGGGSRLRDGGRNTTHHEVGQETRHRLSRLRITGHF